MAGEWWGTWEEEVEVNEWKVDMHQVGEAFRGEAAAIRDRVRWEVEGKDLFVHGGRGAALEEESRREARHVATLDPARPAQREQGPITAETFKREVPTLAQSYSARERNTRAHAYAQQRVREWRERWNVSAPLRSPGAQGPRIAHHPARGVSRDIGY